MILLSGIYDSPKPEQSKIVVCSIPRASIDVVTQVHAGTRWFLLEQETNDPSSGKEQLAVSYEELEELVSGLQDALVKYRAPEQLRLFDPDNPPEAPNEHGVDTAQ